MTRQLLVKGFRSSPCRITVIASAKLAVGLSELAVAIIAYRLFCTVRLAETAERIPAAEAVMLKVPEEVIRSPLSVISPPVVHPEVVPVITLGAGSATLTV